MAEVMTVQCPSCSTEFPVDPAKVPEGGVRTQCTVCETVFRVDPPLEEDHWGMEGAHGVAGAAAGGAVAAAVGAHAGEPEPAEAVVEESSFGESTFGLETEDEDEAEAEPLPMLEGTEPEAETTEGDFGFEAPAGEGDFGFETELSAAPEGEASTDWSSDAGSDWVVETEDVSSFGEAVDVERLDTVEEQMRSAQEEEVLPEEGVSQTLVPESDTPPMDGLMTGDEVMLPEMDVGGELEITPEAVDAMSESTGFELPESGFDLGGVTPEVEAPAPEPEPVVETPPPAPSPPEPAPGGFQFGRRDPHDKARRLARVLVSDMITYNPDRHNQALANGTLKADFEDEIGKSWAEYVEQVGQDMAESTDYWREALNEILAKGEPLF